MNSKPLFVTPVFDEGIPIPPLTEPKRPRYTGEVRAAQIAAKLRKQQKFVCDVPCPFGHTVRYTSNARCVRCQSFRTNLRGT